jgi:hypothetical protein
MADRARTTTNLHAAGRVAARRNSAPQETVANAVPRGWTLNITDVSLGTEGAQLSEFQAYADPATGGLTAVDCNMAFNSDTLRVIVRGATPLAAFTATVSGIRMTGCEEGGELVRARAGTGWRGQWRAPEAKRRHFRAAKRWHRGSWPGPSHLCIHPDWSGELRITPILDQRMLLWGFKKPPAVNVKLAVKGPIGAGADLSQFQFIQVGVMRARVLSGRG